MGGAPRQLLLLPDELCLAEDSDVSLAIEGETRSSFTFHKSLQVHAYLTNYRVRKFLSYDLFRLSFSPYLNLMESFRYALKL